MDYRRPLRSILDTFKTFHLMGNLIMITSRRYLKSYIRQWDILSTNNLIGQSRNSEILKKILIMSKILNNNTSLRLGENHSQRM